MFKNFLKVAIRNIRKQGFYALFNSLGIAMGIACSIVIYLIIQHQQSLDDFHENAAKIFAVNEIHKTNGVSESNFQSPVPLVVALKANSPLITSVVRMYSTPVIAKQGNDVFYENIRLVDADFFKMFSFKLKQGNSEALKDPSGIVLSDEAEKKYFGSAPALGKQLSIVFNDSLRRTFTVSAIAAPFPDNASFTFSLLADISLLKELGKDETDWKLQTDASFIQLNSAESKAQVTSLLDKYVKEYNTANSDNPVQSFYLDNLRDMPKHGYYTRNALAITSPPAAMYILSILAIMVLCMACFNFTNYTLATSTTRFKEIGVRKVLGSSRKQLLIQFLGENSIISLIALALAFLLTQFLFIPIANKIFDYQHITFNPFYNKGLILFLVLLTIGIGILSGLYPALRISNVNTIKVFKNKQNIKGNKSLTRILMVLQYGFSLFTIAASIIFTQNATFLRNLNVGYKKDKIIVLQTDNESNFQFLKAAALKYPNVVNVTGSQDQIGRTGNQSGLLRYEDAQITSAVINVSPEYIEMLNLKFIMGRNFIVNSENDINNAIIVNKQLAGLMNWQNPINKRVQLDGRQYQVIGLTDDFNYEPFFKKIGPCILKMNAPEDSRVISIKLKNDDATGLKSYMHTAWQKKILDKPFETTFQEDVYNISYAESRRTKELLISIAILTIVISSIGLFAQIALSIAKRTKEIGMRKVLGASFFQITKLITRELIFLMMLSAVIFLPLVFLSIKSLFDSVYPYHIPLNAGFLVLTLGVMLTVAVLTIGSLLYKAAIANPVKSLRTE